MLCRDTCTVRPGLGLGLVLAVVGMLLPWPGAAAELLAQVLNDKGEFVELAVVTARPLSGLVETPEPALAVIDQVDKEFTPAVTAVYQGARVSFPNSDNVRHHVYSFSKANAFEIPLYADQTAPPVQFNKPGVVALGCNVHDWMSAHIFIADTPYFAITDASGQARLPALPPGDYTVEVWHAQLRGKPAGQQQIVSVGEKATSADFTIKQRRAWKAWRGASELEEGY